MLFIFAQSHLLFWDALLQSSFVHCGTVVAGSDAHFHALYTHVLLLLLQLRGGVQL